MSRTYAGYLFKCKVCGEIHLLDSGEPHRGILVPCVNSKYSIRKYNRKDFEYWHGLYYDVFNICVQEAKQIKRGLFFRF